MKEESIFEKAMTKYAPYAGCLYVKVPDVVGAVAETIRKQKGFIAYPRPCDAIFISKYGNALIEAKFESNRLTKRQLEFGKKITGINHLFFVIRKKYLKNRTRYLLEDVYGERLFETDNIIKFIKAIRERLLK